MRTLYQSSAPGSMMLMGEHAVLRNKLAIVAAVDKRMRVQLTPQASDHIEIYSSLGEWRCRRQELATAECPIFRFVLAAIKIYQEKLTSGFRLDIHTEFSSVIGLGSSAAVVVATLNCLEQWLGPAPLEHHIDHPTSHLTLFSSARHIIQTVQGSGSGADVAASVFGGITAYRMHPFYIEKSEDIFHIALIYTGYKTPTPEVIKKVNERVKSNPQKYIALFDTMNKYSEASWEAIKNHDWILLGQLMNEHQVAQEDLGVCDEKTHALLNQLKKNKDVLGCKISGSGLGDCVVALTHPGFLWRDERFLSINASLSTQGMQYE